MLWTTGFDPEQVAGLASTRTYPLRSSFRPSYNMAVNLVASMGRDAARVLLESSFAQFQADRAVVGLARQVHRHDEAIAGYEEAMHCELGSAQEYAALRRRLSRRETELARERSSQRRLRADESLRKLRTGDVIRVPAGRRAGLAVVLSDGAAVADTGRLVVLTSDRQVKRLSAVDFPTPVEALGKVRIGRSFNPRSPQSRRDLASSLRELGLGDEHGGDPRHAAAAMTSRRPPTTRSPGCAASCASIRCTAARSASSTCAGPSAPTGSGARPPGSSSASRAVRTPSPAPSTGCAGCSRRPAICTADVDAPEVTPEGRRLARLYAESDLLVAECLRQGVWDELGAARRWPRSPRHWCTSHAPTSTAIPCCRAARRCAKPSTRRSRCAAS